MRRAKQCCFIYTLDEALHSILIFDILRAAVALLAASIVTASVEERALRFHAYFASVSWIVAVGDCSLLYFGF